jgi:hypothetical protein
MIQVDDPPRQIAYDPAEIAGAVFPVGKDHPQYGKE